LPASPLLPSFYGQEAAKQFPSKKMLLVVVMLPVLWDISLCSGL
jgi:hypothetical protein